MAGVATVTEMVGSEQISFDARSQKWRNLPYNLTLCISLSVFLLG